MSDLDVQLHEIADRLVGGAQKPAAFDMGDMREPMPVARSRRGPVTAVVVGIVVIVALATIAVVQMSADKSPTAPAASPDPAVEGEGDVPGDGSASLFETYLNQCASAPAGEVVHASDAATGEQVDIDKRDYCRQAAELVPPRATGMYANLFVENGRVAARYYERDGDAPVGRDEAAQRIEEARSR